MAVANGSAHVNTSDLAIYEQYRNQVSNLLHDVVNMVMLELLVESNLKVLLFICREGAQLSLMVLLRMEIARNRMVFCFLACFSVAINLEKLCCECLFFSITVPQLGLQEIVALFPLLWF